MANRTLGDYTLEELNTEADALEWEVKTEIDGGMTMHYKDKMRLDSVLGLIESWDVDHEDDGYDDEGNPITNNHNK